MSPREPVARREAGSHAGWVPGSGSRVGFPAVKSRIDLNAMSQMLPDVSDREVIQVKIFESALDKLADLEREINTWLRDNREIRPDRSQFNTVNSKRAVVMVWYTLARTARGVGFGEAAPAPAAPAARP